MNYKTHEIEVTIGGRKEMKQKAEETETIKSQRVESRTMDKIRKLAIEEGRSIQGQIRWMLKNYEVKK